MTRTSRTNQQDAENYEGVGESESRTKVDRTDIGKNGVNDEQGI